jgi:branched-chain amino acid transport system permease protein
MLPGVFSVRYEEDIAIVRTKMQWLAVAASLIFIFTVPLYSSSYWLGWFIFLFVWIVAVLGLHVLTGLCGLFSVAQAAFMAVGAYTTGILTMRFGWSPWATLPVAGITTGLAGLIFGIPSLRIKGFYFAMATLAASFIVIWIISYFAGWTGGVHGMYVDRLTLGGIDLGTPGSYFYPAAIITIVMILFATNIQRTRTGRAFIAIRDNDLAAEVMGLHLFRYKILALFIAAFYAGIAGWLWAHFARVINPDQFTLYNSIWMVGILVIGGIGSTAGAVAGTVLLKLLDILSEYLLPILTSAFSFIDYFFAAYLGVILYALVVVIFLIFEPRGLYHRWQRFKTSYRLFPFSY